MYGIIHDTVHIYGTMTWYWLMTWHWPMRCHDPIGLKFLCTIDRWCGSLLVDRKLCVWYIHIPGIICNQTASLFKQPHCSYRITIQTTYCWHAAPSWAFKLFLIRWPWFTQYIYKKRVSPPLIWHPWIHFLVQFSVIPFSSCIFTYFNKFSFWP